MTHFALGLRLKPSFGLPYAVSYRSRLCEAAVPKAVFERAMVSREIMRCLKLATRRRGQLAKSIFALMRF
jgi:hypothetical protein